jgi:hypothetical protein
VKRYVSGLSKADPAQDHGIPDGVFLVRVEHVQYWHAQKPHFSLLFLVLEQKTSEAAGSLHGFTPLPKPFGSSIGFYEILDTMRSYSDATRLTIRISSGSLA